MKVRGIQISKYTYFSCFKHVFVLVTDYHCVRNNIFLKGRKDCGEKVVDVGDVVEFHSPYPQYCLVYFYYVCILKHHSLYL